MLLVVTVRRALTFEVVALHAAGETLALGNAAHIDELARFEKADVDDLPEFIARGVGNAKFREVAASRNPGFGQVSALRVGQAAFLDVAEANLDGSVTVGFNRLDLCNSAGASLYDGDRNDLVVLVPDLRHADLLAQKAFASHLLRFLQVVSAILWRTGVLRRTHACSNAAFKAPQ